MHPKAKYIMLCTIDVVNSSLNVIYLTKQINKLIIIIVKDEIHK